MTTKARPRIGLAFSGGGFRATAFGLGALRALHDRGLLGDVRVVSGISGGSLLAAMWAYGPTNFAEFDESVRELLRTDLQREIVLRAIHPRLAIINAYSTARALAPGQLGRDRTSNRSEAVVAAFAARAFGRKTMQEVTHPALHTVISATDLSTGNAIRFGSARSSCSPYGIVDEPVTVADATAASAAFPVVLPHLNRTYTFTRSDGSTHKKTLLMTDGGVYDNLGLSPLIPGRSSNYTSHVYNLDHIIAIDAGIGREPKLAPNFLAKRLHRSFEIAHTRSQDGMRALIHDYRATSRLDGLTYVYLGMQDSRLPVAVSDLVPRTSVANYRTDFAPVSAGDLELLTTRAEQLTRTLIGHYSPNLGSY
jgi:predicted acylesterase/phospholipase RssA